MSGTLSTTFGNEPVWNSIIEVTTWFKWPALGHEGPQAQLDVKDRFGSNPDNILTRLVLTKAGDAERIKDWSLTSLKENTEEPLSCARGN